MFNLKIYKWGPLWRSTSIYHFSGHILTWPLLTYLSAVEVTSVEWIQQSGVWAELLLLFLRRPVIFGRKICQFREMTGRFQVSWSKRLSPLKFIVCELDELKVWVSYWIHAEFMPNSCRTHTKLLSSSYCSVAYQVGTLWWTERMSTISYLFLFFCKTILIVFFSKKSSQFTILWSVAWQ